MLFFYFMIHVSSSLLFVSCRKTAEKSYVFYTFRTKERMESVHRTDCVSVHKTNRRDTDWAREHGTAHTTFNKTIKHKFSMLQPLSCVPGAQRGKMSRPTWDRMRHNSITDCAIVRVSPATTKEEEKAIDTIVLNGVIRLHCGRCRIDNFYGSSIVLFRLNQQVHMEHKTQPAFSSQISRVCLSGTIDEWFVWDSGIRSVFIFFAASTSLRRQLANIVVWKLLIFASSLSWKVLERMISTVRNRKHK